MKLANLNKSLASLVLIKDANIIKQKFLIIILVSCSLFFGCNNKRNQNYSDIEYKPVASLKEQSVLKFENTDKLFVGSVRDIEVFNENIYISDKTFSKVHVFDSKLKYVSSIGRYGKGPNEFPKAPYLTKTKKELVIIETLKDKLFFYNDKLNLIKELQLPHEYFYQISDPIFLNDTIILSATNKIIRNFNGGIKDYRTVLKIYMSSGEVKSIVPLDDEYLENSNLMYYVRQPFSKVSLGFENTYIIIQQALNKLFIYNNKDELIKTFYYKPRYFKNIPNVPINYQIKSLEGIMNDYYSKMSYYCNIKFDNVNDLLVVSYRNLHPDQYKSRSFIDADNYLCIINNNYECIFDDKIDGYFGTISNGYIYIINEESVKRLVIKKYKVIL